MNPMPTTEQRLLACLVSTPAEVLAAISDGLSPSDFSTTAHREVFVALCRLVAEKTPITLPNLCDLAGNHEALDAIFALSPEVGNRRHLLAMMQEAGEQRKMRTALKNAQHLMEHSASNWVETREQITSSLNAALVPAGRSAAKTWEKICEETRELITLPKERGLPGPFPAWDEQAGRLLPGDLCVLAARPGRGKSAFANQCALKCSASGRVPAIFSFEMSEAQVVERMLTQLSRGGDSQARLAALSRLRKFPLFGPQSARSVLQIEAQARLLANADTHPSLIIVDYLQLVEPPNLQAPREQQVAAVSRRLKCLALELQVPILLLSQLNRSSEIERRLPVLSDLRESGAIEQDADAVWFLHPTDPSDQKATQEIQLIQAKKRSGRANLSIRLRFNAAAVSFEHHI